MASKAGRLQIQLEMQVAQLQRDLDKANRAIENSAKSWAASFQRTAEVFAGAFAAGAVQGAISSVNQLLSETMQRFDDIADGAKRVGVSTTTFQELGYAAEQSGLAMADLEKSLFRMQKGFGEGSQKFKDALTDIGLSFDTLAKQTDKEQFLSIVEALGQVEDTGKRAAAGAALFGKGVQGMGPLIAEGREGIEGMIEAAHRLGIVMSEDAVKAGEAFNDQMDTLKLTFMGLMSQALEPLLPQLTAIAGSFMDTGKNAEQAAGRISIFQKAANFIAEDLIETTRIITQLKSSFQGLAEIGAAVGKRLASPGADGGMLGMNEEIRKAWKDQAARAEEANAAAQRATDAMLRSRIHVVKAWEDTAEASGEAADETDKATAAEERAARAQADRARKQKEAAEARERDNEAKRAAIELERQFNEIMSESDTRANAETEAINRRTLAIAEFNGASREELEIMRLRQQGASEYEMQLTRETQGWEAATDAARERTQLIADQTAEYASLIAGGFDDIFQSLTEGSEEATEAVKRLIVQLVAMYTTQVAMKALGFNSPTSWGFQGVAKGAAFDASGMLPFALGGIVRSATPFTFGGGRAGVMGEAGPEAILPLGRDSAGRLGVRGGGGVVVNVHNNNGSQIGVEQRGNEIDVIVQQVRGVIANDFARGGNIVTTAFEGAYGARR
jgi:hypothetical protein